MIITHAFLCISGVDSTENNVICVLYTIFSVSWDNGKVSEIYVFPIQIKNHLGKVLKNLNLNLIIYDRLLLDNITNLHATQKQDRCDVQEKTV